MKRILMAVSVLLGVTTAFASPSQAVVPSTNFHFASPADRILVFDGRVEAALSSGVPRSLYFAAASDRQRAIVNTVVFGSTIPTKLYFHPCSQAPNLAERAANYGNAGTFEVNAVPIDVATPPCMTLIGDGFVIVHLVGYEDEAAGLNYVAHAEPTELVGSFVDGLYRFAPGALPVVAEGASAWVTITAPENQLAAVQLASCDGTSPDAFWPSLTALAGGYADNLFIVPLTSTREICFQTLAGLPPLEFTVSRYGYLAPNVSPTAEGLPYAGFIDQQAPGFVPLPPARLFDTRLAGGQLGDGGVYRHTFTNLPADATAVAMNITVTGTTGPGFVSAYPCDEDQPLVSNLNYTAAGQTVPNFAIVSLGASAEICFFTLRGTHLLADLAGYFLFDGGDGYVPTAPERLFDTRETGAPVPANGVFVKDFTDYVDSDATSVVINLTVTQPQGSGFVTAYPCGTTPPRVSNLNYYAGQTVPNLVTVKLPADKRVCFYALTRAHLLADLAGWYSPSSDIGFIDETPYRLFDTREPTGGSLPFADDEEFPFPIGNASIKALAWNLTVTDTGGSGFLAVYPCENGLPDVSNVNYTGVGQTTANFAIVTPDTFTDVCLYALTSTHVIVDEAGFFITPYVTEVYYDGAPEPTF
jgi:hypothetical protein